MPDVYNTIIDVDREMVERIAEVLEVRATDTQQRNMLASYLS